MYKIYINSTPLILINDELVETYATKKGEHLIARYAGQAKMLLNYVDMLEKTNRYDSIVIYDSNLEQLYADFVKHYLVLEAGGGLVFNPEQKLLMIYKRGHWDLPKGKIDPGETPEEAAVREVEEETGISGIQLGAFLTKTYHTFRDRKNKRALKLTHWYIMNAPNQELIPQAEEDIEKAEWIDLNVFKQSSFPTYGNIIELIEHYESGVA